MSLEHPVLPRRRRYRRDEASTYLREVHDLPCAPRTLAKLAVVGGGPVMEYVGRFPLYPENGLDEFAKLKTSAPVASTSELRCLRHSSKLDEER
jgi:hypothetical protein